MKYAILILLAGCIHSSSVGTPEEGGSDVDAMELESDDVSTIEPLGVLDGMAGMDGAAGGAGGSEMAGSGGGDVGSGGAGGAGANSGAGGAGGGEGPEAPVGDGDGDGDALPPVGCPSGLYCRGIGLGNGVTANTCIHDGDSGALCGPVTHSCFPCGAECDALGGTCRPLELSVFEGYPETCYIPCTL